MYPQIHDTRITLALTHLFCNSTATLCMLYPEVTNTFIRIRKGKITTLRMRERSGIEIQLHIIFSCPLYPTFEVSRFYLVTVNKFATEVTIDFMKIQAVSSRNIAGCFQYVLSQFFHITSLARIVSGSLNASGQCTLCFKSGYIICLPAMQGEGNLLQGVHCFLYIYADSCVTFFCHFIGFLNQFFFHDGTSFLVISYNLLVIRYH